MNSSVIFWVAVLIAGVSLAFGGDQVMAVYGFD